VVVIPRLVPWLVWGQMSKVRSLVGVTGHLAHINILLTFCCWIFTLLAFLLLVA